MSRVPIRLRVTLAFAAAIALVLAGLGLFLYERLESRLDESIDRGLRSRAADLAALVRDEEPSLGAAGGAALIELDEGFSQVLTPAGDVVDSSPQLTDAPALDPQQAAQASREASFFDLREVPGVDGDVRALGAPVRGDARSLVAVVGSSLDDRDEALASFSGYLALGGLAALLLASAVGYAAVAGALRPVEAMRRRAAAIATSADERERLPVPPAADELRRLGETLNAMLGRLEASLERERRFVDDASHELRTPLALQKTELELALRHASSERELRAAIGSAIEETDRLAQLAEDLLVLARSGDGGLALRPEPASPTALLAAVAERFGARAELAGRSIVVETLADGATEPSLEVDRLRVEQALTSVVDNALRHGGGEVRLAAHRRDGNVALVVSDEGEGFPEEFLPHAFERLTRADPARGRGGSGLGLAIVAAIAEAHGGSAGAANRPTGGAEAWIILPLTRQQPPNVPESML